ncbi:unnamed protein product, partial [Protopolystoma xenopodis]
MRSLLLCTDENNCMHNKPPFTSSSGARLLTPILAGSPNSLYQFGASSLTLPDLQQSLLGMSMRHVGSCLPPCGFKPPYSHRPNSAHEHCKKEPILPSTGTLDLPSEPELPLDPSHQTTGPVGHLHEQAQALPLLYGNDEHAMATTSDGQLSYKSLLTKATSSKSGLSVQSPSSYTLSPANSCNLTHEIGAHNNHNNHNHNNTNNGL